MPELTEEDLKNMSPEQIAELQKQNCLFCQLATGKIPSKKVYEDELCFAIIDINPAAKGHMLLMPKEHYMILPQVPDAMIKHLGIVSKILSKTLIRAIGSQGTDVFIANGAVAGQRAPHLIIHIIPRNDNDGVTCFELPQREIRPEDLENMQKALLSKLGTRVERETVQFTPKPIPEIKQNIQSPPKYFTSANAKRFHVDNCPFADKIPKESRIYLTEEEAEKRGLAPCECTGIKKRKNLEQIDFNQLKGMLK